LTRQNLCIGVQKIAGLQANWRRASDGLFENRAATVREPHCSRAIAGKPLPHGRGSMAICLFQRAAKRCTLGLKARILPRRAILNGDMPKFEADKNPSTCYQTAR
jgi:hypothetical protein